MSVLFQHILLPKNLSTLFLHNGVRLIPTYFITQNSVCLIPTQWCPSYSNIFYCPKMCLPYSYIMVSVLFRHISIAKKVSVLFHLYSVRLIPTLFYLIPTQLKTENSVRLKTAIRKKCPLYYCSELKSIHLIPTLLSPPYSNIFSYSKSVYLIPELCPPQYRRQVSVLFLHSVHFIPTWCLPYSYLVFVYLILTSVRLNVGTLNNASRPFWVT